ncbi:ABC transporter permease [Marasmitruncus massiliensis]|uniref:ABC transporter permease n=1 Tax=Marasmitruncus massiliensis TaxID=1944642 RepID=UPI000C7A7775|nr:ABC transporter permease [Marasmitruncus massiliensis]MBE6906612.1 ABC transporter permease [Oscillospiraceae bacterium]
MDNFNLIGNLLLSVIRTATPILFVALGLLVMQSSGIINMGAEGMMLLGAFVGVIGTYWTGNVWLGVLCAMAASGLASLLFSYFALTFQVNQVVLGVAFNILFGGVTTTLSRSVFGLNSAPPKIDGFHDALFGLPLPVYIAFGLVLAIHLFFYRTKPGLKIRAAGEYPQAVEVVGLSVVKIRLLSSLLGGLFIGFGGAFLSLGQLDFFIENMSNGRGYIALAAVSFGKFTPIGTMLAVLLFGGGEALQYRLQAGNSIIPYQFALMIPYVMTIIALALFIRNASGPAALGKPYQKSH